MTAEQQIQDAHPCFSLAAHNKFARIHLPVAPLCNIGCKYCIRALNKVENRPGVASAIVSPEEALERVKAAKARLPLTVVGIAGPGDALLAFSFPPYSPQTAEAASVAKRLGAAVVGITNQADAPVARSSDAVLVARTETSAPSNAVSAPMVIVHGLATAIAARSRRGR